MFIWPCSHTLVTCSRGKRRALIGWWVFRVNTLRHRILMLCIKCFDAHAGRWCHVERVTISPLNIAGSFQAPPLDQSINQSSLIVERIREVSWAKSASIFPLVPAKYFGFYGLTTAGWFCFSGRLRQWPWISVWIKWLFDIGGNCLGSSVHS